MRIGIFSDTHGNCVALDAALAEMRTQNLDGYLCLGDAIQGGPQPAELVARLRDLDCPVVLGNSDHWLLTADETGHGQIDPERWKRLQETRAWQLAQLSEADLAYIASFQPTVTLDLGGGERLLAFHGSPADFNEFFLPTATEEEFQRILGPYGGQYLTGGHTHLQWVRRLGDHFYFNPGSVGVAYRHGQTGPDLRLDPWAEYAILTVEAGVTSLDFRRVPFDTEQMIRVYREKAPPHAADSIRRYAPR